MLEPTSPAGEPFENDAQESRTTADFEQVCISLVERGWKILPKKGSYPINKQGPRYVNLVDPRGNRKSIRVLDSALWEKLRVVESTRSKKKVTKKHTAKDTESNEGPVGETIREIIPGINTEPAAVTLFPEARPAEVSLTRENELAPQPFQPAEIPELPPEVVHLAVPESPVSESAPAEKPGEIDSDPKSLESYARSRPEFGKSIFELGLDSLVSAIRSESLSPPEIIQRVEDWTRNSKNLIEYVHKLNEPREIPKQEVTGENDLLVRDLQATLKETEDKLAALIRSAREI